jgi:hypothetical protein
MEKRKTGWLHPAHGEKKNGLVASSPWRKEKRAGYIQPMEKRKMGWLHPAHGAKDHREKETWTGFEKRRKESRRIYREMCLPQSVDGVIVLSEILS